MTWWRIVIDSVELTLLFFSPFIVVGIALFVYVKCRKVKVPTDAEIDEYDCGPKHTTCGIETDVKKVEHPQRRKTVDIL